jgi:hypothetical protein
MLLLRVQPLGCETTTSIQNLRSAWVPRQQLNQKHMSKFWRYKEYVCVWLRFTLNS